MTYNYEQAREKLEKARAVVASYKSGETPPEKLVEANAELDECERIVSLVKGQEKTVRMEQLIEAAERDGAVFKADGKAFNESKEEREMKMSRRKTFKSWMKNKGSDSSFKSNAGERELKTFNSMVDSEGGIFTPEEMSTQIIEKLHNIVQIRSRATVLTTTASGFTIPNREFDVVISKVAQSKKTSKQSVPKVFGKTRIVPKKTGALITIPQELLEDEQFDLESYISAEVSRAFAEDEESDFISGEGGDSPLGLVNAGFASVEVAGSGADITPEDIIKTPYELTAIYRRLGVWLAHRKSILKVRLLRDDTGGAGTGRFMWQPSLQAGVPPTLDGFPVLESEFFPDGTATDADAGTPLFMFGDLSRYWIVDRVGVSVQRLNELYSEEDEIGFKFRKRMDAAPIDRNAFVFLDRAADAS